MESDQNYLNKVLAVERSGRMSQAIYLWYVSVLYMDFIVNGEN